MFTEFHIKNFKSLRDVVLPVSPRLTVFVGANNSGKSNALAALGLLGEVQRKGMANQSPSVTAAVKSMIARGESSFEIAAKGVFAATELTYTLTANSSDGLTAPGSELVTGKTVRLGVDPADPSSHISTPDGSKFSARTGTLLTQYLQRAANKPDFLELSRELASIQIFDLSVSRLRQQSKYTPGITLMKDGGNLAAVLDGIRGERPDLFEAIEKEICLAATEVKRLTIPYAADNADNKVLGVQELTGQVYRADEMSDGLVLFVGLAAVATLREDGLGELSHRLVAIEEPERGIHPRRIREVIDYLRRLASRGAQVILTTHSPLVLDEFIDVPECVVLFDRTSETGTMVRRLTDIENWDKLITGQPLGESWYSGILGGVPR